MNNTIEEAMTNFKIDLNIMLVNGSMKNYEQIANFTCGYTSALFHSIGLIYEQMVAFEKVAEEFAVKHGFIDKEFYEQLHKKVGD